ncbi:MAG: antitoxin family protein [Planctomycetota bacterium]
MNAQSMDEHERRRISDEDVSALLFAAFSDAPLDDAVAGTSTGCCTFQEIWAIAIGGSEKDDLPIKTSTHLENCDLCKKFLMRVQATLQESRTKSDSGFDDVFDIKIPALAAHDELTVEISGLAAADALIASRKHKLGTLNLKLTSLRSDLAVELRVGEGDLTSSIFESPKGRKTPNVGCIIRFQNSDSVRELFLFENASGVFSRLEPTDLKAEIKVRIKSIAKADVDEETIGALESSKKELRDPRWSQFYDDWIAAFFGQES